MLSHTKDLIQLYKPNKYIELRVKRKILVKSNIKSIIILAIMACLLKPLFKIKMLSAYMLEGWLIYVVLLTLHLLVDGWFLKLNNNIISIKRTAILPKCEIPIDKLIDIKVDEIYMEIIYLNKNNKMRKKHLYIYTDVEKKLDESSTGEFLDFEEFVGCFSHYVVDSDLEDGSEWKSINRDEEKLEIIRKRQAFDKKINSDLSFKGILIVLGIGFLGMIALMFIIPILYKLIHGY